MSSHRKSTQYETADSLTFSVPQFSSPNTPRKLLSDKKRDPKNPEILWRLKVYPSGNGTPGFLALYIDIPSKHALPEDWSCSREITFTLHHPTDPNKTIFKRTNHTFNDDEPDWGYNQIIPVIALSQRGFLQNDTIKVTATFRPVDDAPEQAPKEEPVSPIVTTPTEVKAAVKEPPKQPHSPVPVISDQDGCKVVISEFSKAGCSPSASEWRPFTPDADSSKFEWRLIVCPRSGAESVSAYIDVRAKDVRNDKWEETVSATIIVDHPKNRNLSLPYSFTKVFKAEKHRKGFPMLSLIPILTKGGFIADDKLSVSATATIVPAKTEKPKKHVAAIDALQVQVHGFLSYDNASPANCKIVSAWHKLEKLGRWRTAVYPVGTAENAGFVSAVIEFQPGDELKAVEDWSVRVLCLAAVASKPGAKDLKDDSDACIAVLNAKQMTVTLNKVVAIKTLTERKDDYLNWDPECTDDDTLRLNVMFRTCRPSGPKAYIDELIVDMCLKDVQSGIEALNETVQESLKSLVEPVYSSSRQWNLGMKELEEAYKNQMDALKAFGTVFDHKDKIELLNRKLKAMNEEKDSCMGKGLPVEDLNAKELEMRSTLKKLLLLQTTGGNAGNKDKSKEEKVASDENDNEGAEPQNVEVPKWAIDSSEILGHHVALLDKLHILTAQCERTGALTRTLCGFRTEMEKYIGDVQKCISDEATEREELVKKEKSLETEFKDANRECQILRGDNSLLNTLSPEEVTKYVDFVMEAVGQVAVAKYLTKK